MGRGRKIRKSKNPDAAHSSRSKNESSSKSKSSLSSKRKSPPSSKRKKGSDVPRGALPLRSKSKHAPISMRKYWGKGGTRNKFSRNGKAKATPQSKSAREAKANQAKGGSK